MRLHIPRQEIMAVTGSGLLRLIQNEHMPKLDLFVRESIQNSLDASPNKKEYSRINFGYGTFKQELFAGHLEGITNILNERYKNKECRYLYVRDEGKGLRGPLHFSMESESGERDLQKLVYEVAKAQEAQGAGGSWGLGKTVYFRMGIGLVLYYSRIKTDKGYETRMAACLVEKETDPNSILNKSDIEAKRGLAWWGDSYEYIDVGSLMKGTVPIVNTSEIDEIISVFGVEPFKNDETGTVIIIPYVEKEKLLSGSTINQNDDGTVVSWSKDVERYLDIATQRWYAPRLNNPAYTKANGRPFLQVFINGKWVGENGLRGTFKQIQNLYNCAIGKKDSDGINNEQINLRMLFDSTCVGHVAYKKFNELDLRMTSPNNEYNPFQYIWNDDDKISDAPDGRVILAYTRKPGMIVTYEAAGEWVKSIRPYLKPDEYLLIMFALNSDNKFKDNEKYSTIEDYFRDSEEADHSSWHDMQIGSSNLKILFNIQQQLKKKINKKYKPIENEEEKSNSALSKLFGDMILPPKGFGKKATKKKTSGPVSTITVSGKKIKAKVLNKKMKITEEGVKVPVLFAGELKESGIEFSLEVVTYSGNIPLEKWEDKIGIKKPFKIKGLAITKFEVNNEVIKDTTILESNNHKVENLDVIAEAVFDEKSDMVGLRIKSKEESKKINLECIFMIEVSDRTAQVGYKLKEVSN